MSNEMKVTFKVTDGLYGRGGFETYEAAKNWFDEQRATMYWANLYVEFSRREDGATTYWDQFLIVLERSGED
jgi:hypothetical protein